MNDKEQRTKLIYLLTNDKFVEWQLFKSADLDIYWEEYINQHAGDKEIFEKAVGIFKKIQFNNYKLSQIEETAIFERVKQKIDEHNRKKQLRFNRYRITAVACSLLLLIGVSYWLMNDRKNLSKKEVQLAVGQIQPSQDIILISGGKTYNISQKSNLRLNTEGVV